MRKNILVVIPENYRNNESFLTWIGDVFSDDNLDLFVYNSELIDAKLITSDYVLNFLGDNEFYILQQKIESLGLKYFGSSLLNQKLFSEKIRFKKIIQLSNFKTPVFEKIHNRTFIELFNNFPQPSRIFSKKNNYFSGKIDSLEKLREIFEEKEDISDYYVEEYIDGQDIYALFDTNDMSVYLAEKKDGGYYRLDPEIKDRVRKKITDFVLENKIDGFGLINLKLHNRRGLYFLNIFLKNIDLFKKRDYMEGVLKVDIGENLKFFIKKNLS